MDSTAFNYCGFIQPKFLIEMLNRDDQDGFYDRIMVCCPGEILVPFKDLQAPMPQDIVNFYDVFTTLRQIHQGSEETIKYTFNAEALQKFGEMHDNLLRQKHATDDENKRGHLVKAITHLVRLAGLLHVMELVFDGLKAGKNVAAEWSNIITPHSLDKAWTVIEYCLAQKWALMPPSFGGVCADGDEGFIATYRDYLVKFLTSPIKPLTATRVVQNRLAPRLPDATGKLQSRVNMDSALSFMERLNGIGFGKIDSTTTGKNRRAMKTFVKRPFDEPGTIKEATCFHQRLQWR